MTGALVLVDPDGAARRTSLTREIGELLAKLAVHAAPHDVALALEAGGWTGLVGDAGACPVAKYLRDAITASNEHGDYDDSVVLVRRYGVLVLDPEPDGSCIEQHVGTPAVVGAFIGRFDAGAYPQLDTTPHPLRRIP
jgi:hypothetical protein